MARKTYTEADIQVLEYPENIQRRPGMYVGGKGASALHHLAIEVIDNAVDEALAGRCSKVEVTIRQGRIQKIHFLDDRGTPAFTERMRAVLPQRMVQAGHADVDGVSGATLSSDNLKKAVNNALNKAR